MKKKQICSRCKKPITGKINVEVRKRKVGQKYITEFDYYDQACFKKRNLERSWHVHREKEALRKRKNNK